MRYITWAEVVARYPKVAEVATAEATKIEDSYIAGVEGEIDAALSARYTVPLASTPTAAPSLVKDIAVDLVYYKVMLLKLDDEQSARLDKYIQRRLLGLACGSFSLVSSGGVVVAPALSGAYSTVESRPNVSGMDDVEDWAVSSGELLIESSRRGFD